MYIGEMLSVRYTNQKKENRNMVLIILISVCYLARQGLALYGWYKANDDSTKSREFHSNFLQLLKLCAEDNPSILQWIKWCQNKYTSPDIQNEMLGINMALSLLKDIAAEVSYMTNTPNGAKISADINMLMRIEKQSKSRKTAKCLVNVASNWLME